MFRYLIVIRKKTFNYWIDLDKNNNHSKSLTKRRRLPRSSLPRPELPSTNTTKSLTSSTSARASDSCPNSTNSCSSPSRGHGWSRKRSQACLDYFRTLPLSIFQASSRSWAPTTRKSSLTSWWRSCTPTGTTRKILAQTSSRNQMRKLCNSRG